MDVDDDEDVVQEGSPLHEHLVREGFLPPSSSSSSRANSRDGVNGIAESKTFTPTHKRSRQVKWPERVSNAELEVQVAKKILMSDLLVQEDEDFISNFILSEDALDALEKLKAEEQQNAKASGLGDALFFGGSLAAAAATVLYLSSEKTRLAATVASVIPAALAAVSSVGERWSRRGPDVDPDQKELEALVDQLLSDMKTFKQLVRKSLNLIQGMELMDSGFTLAVNPNTGAANSSLGNLEDVSKVNKALSERGVTFPALRKAAFRAAVDLIQTYRKAVQSLMNVSPLADHVDLKEHYIAFVELKNFGISEEVCDEAVSVRELRDVVQLGLIQQSEYLRRFSLAFSDKVREDNGLDKAGLLGQVKDVVSTLQSINGKLSRVFDFHQAMGVMKDKKKPKALVKKRKDNLDLIPLRSVYTSLFSTGLHLQNSLLKVRELEETFDKIEQRKTKDTNVFTELLPTDEHLITWLRSFQAIQSELNACVGCLDEGVAQIDLMQVKQNPTSPRHRTQDDKPRDEDKAFSLDPQQPKNMRLIDENTIEEQIDEVFEAFIAQDRLGSTGDDLDDTDPLSQEDRKKLKAERLQSKRLMAELRVALVNKAKEHRKREALAVMRKEGQSLPKSEDAFLLQASPSPANDGVKSNGFEDSFSDLLVKNDVIDSEDSESGSSSDPDTVKSAPRIVNGGRVDHGSSSSLSSSDDNFDHDNDTSKKNMLRPAPSVDSLAFNNLHLKVKESDPGSSCSLAELRSISSPDLKNLSKETSSPYVSLEKLQRPVMQDSSDSDGNGSADEMHHQVLKTYRRPLRPAASKRHQNGGSSSSSSRRQKRDRNRTIINGSSSSSVSFTNSYIDIKENEANPIFRPSAPAGFGAAVALQAASKAMNFGLNGHDRNEEVFGSDSE